MPRPQKIKIRIGLIHGQWYAMPGNNNPSTRLALVPAISFCKRLNEKRKQQKGQT